jgi:hypothetical protein
VSFDDGAAESDLVAVRVAEGGPVDAVGVGLLFGRLQARSAIWEMWASKSPNERRRDAEESLVSGHLVKLLQG